MIRTVNELIKHLQDTYELDEVVVGTIYSQADIDLDWLDKSDNVSEIWNKVSGDFVGCIDYVQETLNEELLELVEEAKA